MKLTKENCHLQDWTDKRREHPVTEFKIYINIKDHELLSVLTYRLEDAEKVRDYLIGTEVVK